MHSSSLINIPHGLICFLHPCLTKHCNANLQAASAISRAKPRRARIVGSVYGMAGAVARESDTTCHSREA